MVHYVKNVAANPQPPKYTIIARLHEDLIDVEEQWRKRASHIHGRGSDARRALTEAQVCYDYCSLPQTRINSDCGKSSSG